MPITRETLEFLMENRLQNSRTWFHDHKADYQRYVVAPMRSLAQELGPTMEAIDPAIITIPQVGKVISHINRDIRYTKDKTLYREVMWLAYTRDKKRYPLRPGFFFEFSPDGFRYGCGCYYMPPSVMDRMRRLVLENRPVFKAAKKEAEGQTHFGLEGDFYKRPHFPEQPADLRPWLERKELSMIHNSQDFDLLFSQDLGKVLSHNLMKIRCFYAFMLAGTVEADVI